jgi:putative spermidine/putrescine transport system ATP-binding protein/spermidine/putrescine transport system ATP-binding protein
MGHGNSDLMLEVADVVHHFGNVIALDHVSLEARKGEFLTILGESGSGKTTLLRVISGLERPTSVRRLAIDGEDVADRPAAQRNCTTVFQSYALFPHMSVAENVGYGLKVRGVRGTELAESVGQALGLVRLAGKEDRRISQLSGGERQRVALARALVTRPAVLLLDEPLGALDEKLRLEMQSELVDIQRSLGVTFVYITHSQEEALTMSDRVILMRAGRIEQSGTPVELFDHPISRFAAEFMGFENLLPGVVRGAGADGSILVAISDVLVRGFSTRPQLFAEGTPALVAMRAERIVPERRDGESAANVVPCKPARQVYRGKYVHQIADTPIGAVRLRNWDRLAAADHFDAITWRPEDCVVLPQ